MLALLLLLQYLVSMNEGWGRAGCETGGALGVVGVRRGEGENGQEGEGSKAKEKYRGVFEIQRSGDKTSPGEIVLDIRTHASPKVGQDQVSGGVSVLCKIRREGKWKIFMRLKRTPLLEESRETRAGRWS